MGWGAIEMGLSHQGIHNWYVVNLDNLANKGQIFEKQLDKYFRKRRCTNFQNLIKKRLDNLGKFETTINFEEVGQVGPLTHLQGVNITRPLGDCLRTQT